MYPEKILLVWNSTSLLLAVSVTLLFYFGTCQPCLELTWQIPSSDANAKTFSDSPSSLHPISDVVTDISIFAAESYTLMGTKEEQEEERRMIECRASSSSSNRNVNIMLEASTSFTGDTRKCQWQTKIVKLFHRQLVDEAVFLSIELNSTGVFFSLTASLFFHCIHSLPAPLRRIDHMAAASG